MATDHSHNLAEAELFYQYLGARIADDGREAPVVDLVADFQDYCRELDNARGKIRAAELSSSQGESKPLDLDRLLQRVEQRWTNTRSSE